MPILLPIVNKIFTAVADRNCPAVSLMNLVMERDVKLFKGARTAFHNLIMATVLMENEKRKIFAREFTQVRGCLFSIFSIE